MNSRMKLLGVPIYINPFSPHTEETTIIKTKHKELKETHKVFSPL